jgi:hypothetical protein
MKPPFPWVKIEWIDAYTDDEWNVVEDYVIHEQRVQSEGYLVKENDEYVVLAPNVSYNPESKTWAMMGALVVTRRMISGEIATVQKRVRRKPKQPPATTDASEGRPEFGTSPRGKTRDAA